MQKYINIWDIGGKMLNDNNFYKFSKFFNHFNKVNIKEKIIEWMNNNLHQRIKVFARKWHWPMCIDKPMDFP